MISENAVAACPICHRPEQLLHIKQIPALTFRMERKNKQTKPRQTPKAGVEHIQAKAFCVFLLPLCSSF